MPIGYKRSRYREEHEVPQALSGPRFERIAWEEAGTADDGGYPNPNLFQSTAWLSFLAEIQNAEPVAAVLRDGSQELGRFSGLLVRRWGFRFLGSPLPGWTTPYMGFDLRPGVSRRV